MRGDITIKSNPIPARLVTHKLENNNTKEVLPLLWRYLAPCQASQPGDLAKGLWIWLWGQMGLDDRISTGLGETATPLLQGTSKILPTLGPREKEFPTGNWTRHTCWCWKFSCGGMGLQRLSTGRGHWQEQSWEQSLVVSPLQFSCSVMSDSLRPHGLQHARPPCLSPTSGVYPNSCPLRQWCHPTISSSVIPFSSCLQPFPTSGSFQMSQFFASGGQSVGSFSFNISPSNKYSGLISFRMDWLDLLEVQGTLKSLLQHHSSKASILRCSAFFIVQLSRPCMTTGKTIALTRRTFFGKVMSLLFNMLSRLVIPLLPRSKTLLILWLWSPSAVILEP